MAATNERTVTVFGGTGFLGRRAVRHLRKLEFSVRVASRHPDRGKGLFGLDDPQLHSVKANIHDEQSVARALAGAYRAAFADALLIRPAVMSALLFFAPSPEHNDEVAAGISS